MSHEALEGLAFFCQDTCKCAAEAITNLQAHPVNRTAIFKIELELKNQVAGMQHKKK